MPMLTNPPPAPLFERGESEIPAKLKSAVQRLSFRYRFTIARNVHASMQAPHLMQVA